MNLKLPTLLLAGLLLVFHGIAQQPKQDKTLSPYLWVKSDSSSAEQLPLKHTEAEVNVAGIIADVKIRQVYQNEGKIPLEAVYVFPSSTRAAVYAMQMRIGKREIDAVIKEKEQAREIYEKAKEKSQTASLLEQQRPNVFQMNVANILPGDSIVIEMSYTELLKPTDGIYEFVFPTVVGPRYSEQPTLTASVHQQWIQSPYTSEGLTPTYTFDFSGRIAGGLPVREVMSPSHSFKIDYDEEGAAILGLNKEESTGGNRDVVIRYSLKGEELKSGMMTYQEKGEKFFLWTIQPPKRVKPEDIPGREYIFIVDVSGSMSGFPLDISKKLLRDLIGNLRPTDRFNVILFASISSMMDGSVSLPATEQNIENAIQFIDAQRGGGGTSLLPALERGLSLKETPGYSRSFVICTDGYVTVEQEAYDLMREKAGKANMFAFGIGSSVNRFIIEGLAETGMGEPFVVLNQQKAPEIAKKFREYIASPVLTDIAVQFVGMDVYDIEPLGIPDIFAQRPITIFGKYKGKMDGEATLTGISGGNQYEDRIQLDRVKPDKRNRALRYLWARERIRRLSDMRGAKGKESSAKEVTQLGLQYNLLTDYTSFVAVDRRIRNKTGQDTTIHQPLPLPQDVSNQALGNVVPGLSVNSSSVNGNTGYSVPYSVSSLSSVALEEVVVVGYGSQRKSDLTGCVVSLSENSSVQANNPIRQLQGRAAGVQITGSSGSPGATQVARIRGASTISGNGQPLIVIDGVPVVNNGTLTGPASQIGAYGGRNDILNHIDPANIESVSVLKDGLATALYGARAANGVIVIKTKTGDIGKQSWEWTSRAGLNMPVRSRTSQNEELKSAWQQYHQLSFSRGNDKGKLYSSVSFLDQHGIVPQTGMNRLNARLNMERSWKEKLKFDLRISGSHLGLNQRMTDLFGINNLAEPQSPGWKSDIEQYNGQFNGVLSWNINPAWTWKSQLGMDVQTNQQHQFHQILYPFTPGLAGNKEHIESRLWSGIQTHKLSFDKQTGYHSLKTVLMGSHQSWTWIYLSELGRGLGENDPLSNAIQQEKLEAKSRQGITSLATNLKYSFDDRYMLSGHLSLANQRQQGLQLPWKLFPSLGFAWNVDEEDFFYTNGLISELKLRSSWALNGNDRLPLLQEWVFRDASNPLQDPFYTAFLSRRRLPESLDWEIQSHLNTGVDIHLFNGRLQISTDLYQKTTYNFLAEVPVVSQAGTLLELQNVGTVRNRGWEFGLESHLYQSPDFSIAPSVNFTRNRNQVLALHHGTSIQTGTFDLQTAEFVPIGLIEAGQPLGNFYGLPTDDQGNAATEAAIIGNSQPKFHYGIGLDTEWKMLSLSILGVGVNGAEILNFQRLGSLSVSTEGITDLLVEDGSYFRLQKLSLSAQLPRKLMSGKLKPLKQVEFDLSVYNLKVWTSYSGYDPEVNIFGANRYMLYGVDYGAFPRPRSWQLGVHVKF